MKRFEATRTAANALGSHLVTCYLGSAAEELYASGDERRFLYVLGSMGVASSVGLGVALASHRRVLAFEGDGSILMNLGALVTAAQFGGEGFVLAIVDNRQHGATGGQATATARGLDLAELAHASGFTRIWVCRSPHEIELAALEIAYAKGPVFVHLVVEPGDGPRRVVDLEPAVIVRRIQSYCRSPSKVVAS